MAARQSKMRSTWWQPRRRDGRRRLRCRRRARDGPARWRAGSHRRTARPDPVRRGENKWGKDHKEAMQALGGAALRDVANEMVGGLRTSLVSVLVGALS